MYKINFFSRIGVVVVSLFWMQVAWAAPTAQHPRIWLDNSVLTELRAAEQANTADWVEFKTYLDTYIGTSGYDARNPKWGVKGAVGGYRLSGYLDALSSYALGYQILKESNPTLATQYGNYAVQILLSIPHSFRAGEEDDAIFPLRMNETADRTINSAEATKLGISSVGTKNGYAARNIGVGMALAYDWCHDLMTEAQRNTISAVLYRYVDWYAGRRSTYNNGVLIDGVRYHEDIDGDCTGINNCEGVDSNDAGYHYANATGNFYSGNLEMTVLTGIATYGDNPDSTTYYNIAETAINDFVAKADDVGWLKGGDPVESWQYGSGYFRDLQSVYAMYTSGANTTIFNGFEWPDAVTRAHMHVTSGNIDKIHTYGRWTSQPAGVIYQKFEMYQLGVMGHMNPTADINRKAAWFYSNANVLGNSRANKWENFLWATPIANITPLTLDGNEPRSYTGMGIGLAAFRETWAQGGDPVAGFVRLEGIDRNDKEDGDEGTILLMRGSDRLLSHQNPSAGSTRTTSIVFNRSSHYGSNSCIQTESAIKHVEEGGDYYYVHGDVSNAYRKCQYPNPYADLFKRSLLYLRPGILVVRDVTSVTTSRGLVTESFANVESTPTISGNSFTVDVGDSTMTVNYLYPAATTAIAYNWGDGFYAVANTPTVEQQDNQFLQVISTGAVGANPVTSTTLLTGTNVRGTVINTNTTDYTVVFSDTVPETELSDFSYTSTVPSSQYLIDLQPGREYRITSTGAETLNTVITATSAGIGIFTTSVAGITNITVDLASVITIRADVDQQNGINTTDASLTLRNSLGLNMSMTHWQPSATTGDVNCDNTSNFTDAYLILRYSLGLSMNGTGWCVN